MNWPVVVAVLLTLSLWGSEKLGEDLWSWKMRILGYLIPLAWGWALA